MQEKLLIQYSGVVSLFSYQCMFSNYFYFQINVLGSGVRTNIPQAVLPDSNPCRAINFYDFTDISQKFQLFPMAQWEGQQGSEAVRTGFNGLQNLIKTFAVRRRICRQ